MIKHPKIQFRLSSLIFAAIVVSLLLRLNFDGGSFYDGLSETRGFTYFGWPIPLKLRDEIRFVSHEDRDKPINQRSTQIIGPADPKEIQPIGLLSQTLCIACNIFLLFISSLIVEVISRVREQYRAAMPTQKIGE